MKHFTSCGFLIQSKGKFLLCHPSNLRVGKLAGDKGWGLPKGKLDTPDEDKFQCALRETREETNLDLTSVIADDVVCSTAPIFTTNYLTTFHGERISKTVHIFYAFDEDGILQQQKLSCPSLVDGTNIPEMDDFRWVTRKEALEICTRSLRDLFENLETYVSNFSTKS